MEGIDNPPELKGVIPRTFEHIFQSIQSAKKDTQFLVRASYLELYNEEIVDLLSKGLKKLEIREKPDSGNTFFKMQYSNLKSKGSILRT